MQKLSSGWAVLACATALGLAAPGGCATPGDGETDSAAEGGGDVGSGSGGSGGGCVAEAERCDGVDNDCDGDVDEDCACSAGDSQTCYSGPPELEGIGACVGGTQICDETGTWGSCDGETVPSDETCDGADNDCDEQVDENLDAVTCGLGICQVTVDACDDGVPIPCLPGQPNPAGETCDGTDDNCDGQVDEGCTCVTDETQECYSGSIATQGVGTCSNGTQTCDSNGEWGPCLDDVTPTSEICDGEDNDCDDDVDENDPEGGGNCSTGLLGVCAAGTEHCLVGEIECTQDVQSSVEQCNGLDDDCDGEVDQDNPEGGAACDTMLLGVCKPGVLQCVGGDIECEQTTQPTDEICNGLDDNCNGFDDEGDPGGGGACSTGLLGVCAAGTEHCSGGDVVCQQNVMDGPETCNGLDDDCDGAKDENDPGGGGACDTGLMGVCSAGTDHCVAGDLICQQNVQSSQEICNGADDDCDGTEDNGNPGGGNACATGNLGVCSPGTTACVAGDVVCEQDVMAGDETCNNLDDDCDGTPDQGDPEGGAACSTGLLGACAAGTEHCTSGDVVCQQNTQSKAEVCSDAVDDDCDGEVDDGCCAHSKCIRDEGPMANGCDGCVTEICAVDPYCCDTAWDALCVSEVESVCGYADKCPDDGTCGQELCDQGELETPLVDGCDNDGCVAQICAVDPYCCGTDWDSLCVSEVTSVCGFTCDT